MDLREDVLPPLFSHFLSSPADSHTERNRERVKQNLARREKCISLKVMQEERVPQQKRSMGLVYVTCDVHLHFQDSVPCSVQISTTLHFRVKSPWKRFLPCRWDQKGQRNATSYTPSSCETPVITSHFSLPQLCHSCFFTQNLPLALSLQITRAKSLMLALNTAAAKLNFAHSVWKFWSSSVRNNVEIMSTFLSNSKEHCNFRSYLLNWTILSKYYIKQQHLPTHFCEPNFHPVILSKGLLYPQHFICETT